LDNVDLRFESSERSLENWYEREGEKEGGNREKGGRRKEEGGGIKGRGGLRLQLVDP
jgi:hypothetical protein